MTVRRLRGAALLGLQAAVVLGLWWSGRTGLALPASQPWRWLESSPPEVALAGVLRLAGLVLAAWLLLATLAGLLAGATRRPGAARAARRLTLPVLRPLLDRTLALALAGTALTATPVPALAAALPVSAPFDPATSIAEDRPATSPGAPVPAPPPPPPTAPPGGGGAAPYLPPGFTGVLDVPATPTPAPPAPASPAPVSPAPASPEPAAGTGAHTVVAGDNLWRIAVARVADATAEPTAREVHAYWLRLIAANQPSLRSGDPDLIHPGEVLTLPPLMPGAP